MRNAQKKSAKAEERYAAFVGKHVIIYYRDMRDRDRKVHGIISDIVGDNVYLHNGEWSGMLDCSNARVTLVSTVVGWNHDDCIESKEERGLFAKWFNL